MHNCVRRTLVAELAVVAGALAVAREAARPVARANAAATRVAAAGVELSFTCGALCRRARLLSQVLMSAGMKNDG